MKTRTLRHPSLLRNAILSTPLIAWELHQLAIVDILQLLAVQLAGDLADSTRQRCQHVQCEIRLRLSSELVRKAGRVVPLEEICRVHRSASEVRDIKASEGVCLPLVTADVEEFGLEIKTSVIV